MKVGCRSEGNDEGKMLTDDILYVDWAKRF